MDLLILIISFVVMAIILGFACYAIFKGIKLDKVISAAKIITEKALKSENATELKNNIKDGYLKGEYNEALKQILDELVNMAKKDDK